MQEVMERAWERMSMEKHCLEHSSGASPRLKTSSKREFGFLMSPKRGCVCLVPGLALGSYLCKSPQQWHLFASCQGEILVF